MKLSIRTVGQGPDLVLIHGWAMHGGIFAPLSERLSTRFRLHVVDLPGHGHSHDYESGSLTPERVARSIAQATPAAIWMGWSLGGLIALRGALDFPDQVSALVEIAASPRFVRADDWPDAVPATIFREFGAGLVSAFRPAIERFLALETLGSANAQEELRELKAHVFERGDPSEQALLDGLAILDQADYRKEIASLKMPSLWIAGRRDRLIPPAAMRWAAQHSGRGEFLEISAGHAPFLSHADQVAEAITAFAQAVIPA
ncbi:MAG: pimeloyl-ACP methyl ester esterase BioH [Dokdonella sp.]